MLSNAYFRVNFRVDTAANEPAKNLQNFANLPAEVVHFRRGDRDAQPPGRAGEVFSGGVFRFAPDREPAAPAPQRSVSAPRAATYPACARKREDPTSLLSRFVIFASARLGKTSEMIII